ncbi:MAG: DUF3048 domain-containing protein [Bacillota bacterium]
MKIPAKKRTYLLLGGVALLLALLVVLVLREKGPVVHTFSDLSMLQAEEVQQLIIRNGPTGEQLEVEDRESIAAFLEILAPLTFQKERNMDVNTGWTHMVDLYRDEDNFLRLVFAGDGVDFAFYEQGRKEREEKFSISYNISFRLQEYFTRMLEARETREKEDALPASPATVTLQEIEPAICVVINNYPAARPSSGLQQADIVYEFLVEGGTTRYLAVYKRKHLEDFDIGPVRSLRPYFAVQSLEYGGIIAHSGYSTRTMQMVSGLGLFQIGDVGDNFWRDRTRQAPHNLCTCIDNLYRVALNRIQTVERTYDLEQEVKVGYQVGKDITVNYAAHNRVSYLYDETEGVYYRYINDTPHTDRETGKQYYADRVIIRETSHRNVPGPEGLVDIDLQGSGEGLLYEKGRKYYITWENKGRQTTFFYATDMPVKPIPGSTWIQVVRR